MNIEAIVFDLDGVLLNSEPSWQEAITQAVEGFGGTWTADDRQAMNRHMTPEGWSSWIQERASLSASKEEVRASILDNLIAGFHKDLPLVPGAKETIRVLSQEYPLALASGSDRVVVEAFLHLSALDSCFSFSLAAEDTEKPKPDPEIYQKAIDLLGSRATCTMAVEDSTVGIESALGAGLTTVCYLDEERPAKNLDRVHLVLRQLGALPELLIWPRASA